MTRHAPGETPYLEMLLRLLGLQQHPLRLAHVLDLVLVGPVARGQETLTPPEPQSQRRMVMAAFADGRWSEMRNGSLCC